MKEWKKETRLSERERESERERWNEHESCQMRVEVNLWRVLNYTIHGADIIVPPHRVITVVRIFTITAILVRLLFILLSFLFGSLGPARLIVNWRVWVKWLLLFLRLPFLCDWWIQEPYNVCNWVVFVFYTFFCKMKIKKTFLSSNIGQS